MWAMVRKKSDYAKPVVKSATVDYLHDWNLPLLEIGAHPMELRLENPFSIKKTTKYENTDGARGNR